MPDFSFRDTESYHETFPTPGGWILVMGEVSLRGDTVELSNFLIESLETKSVQIGPSSLYQIRRKILDRVQQAGYTYLVIDGERISGANPHRPVRIRRKA